MKIFYPRFLARQPMISALNPFAPGRFRRKRPIFLPAGKNGNEFFAPRSFDARRKIKYDIIILNYTPSSSVCQYFSAINRLFLLRFLLFLQFCQIRIAKYSKTDKGMSENEGNGELFCQICKSFRQSEMNETYFFIEMTEHVVAILAAARAVRENV